VLITLVCGMFIFLITFVVPQFAKLYDQIGTKLPSITLAMLALGKAAQHYILYILPLAALLGYLVWRWSRTDAGAERIDGIRIKLPLFGKIWLKYQVAMFARTLSTLLSGGIPLVPSLETAARSITSKRISKAVFSSVTSVREGKALAKSLESTKVFPELSTEMIDVGESTGALPQMLNSVAEFFEDDVQTALTASLALIEPAILIVMGVVVVVILIALYLPIFSMSNAQNFRT
jgi:type IV pilus assembly protein PilC